MRINNLPLFSTPVTVVDDFLSIDQCRDIMALIDTGTVISKPYGALTEDSVTSYRTLQYFLPVIAEQLPLCHNIINDLQLIVNQYTQATGYRVGALSNSWFSVQTRGSKLLPHTHPHASLSGVMYINTDRDSSPLVFTNPNRQILAYQYFDKVTEFTTEQYIITPVTGQLVLFPSWLIHSSDNIENQTDKRTIISFNYLP